MNSPMDHSHAAGPSSTASQIPDTDDGDLRLADSEYLTRDEVMKRRARRLRRLARCYRDHYWALMEDMRRKHRDYVWKYGAEPYKAELYGGGGEDGGAQTENVNINGGDVDNGGGGKLGLGPGSYSVCKFASCQAKAMALTTYCLAHILSDPKQVLYTGCQQALKCGDDPILCGKTALKSTGPSMCTSHMRSNELNIRKALRKGGIPGTACNKLATKFHLVLTEYVKLIQNKRRAMISKRVDNGGTT